MHRDALRRLGEIVRRRRRRLGLTQADVGGDRVSKSFISQLEKGAASPSLPTLLHVGRRLDIAPGALLYGADSRARAAALLDMAEAAVMVEGARGGRPWIQQLETLFPVAELPRHDLGPRWHRYVGVVRLQQGDGEEAAAALASCSEKDRVASYWLGAARRRTGRLLQALRAWEAVVAAPVSAGEEGPPPLLVAAARWQLAALYEQLGDGAEAAAARAAIDGPGGDGDRGAAPPADNGGAVWLRAAPAFARLLWAEALSLWRGDDVAAAGGTARSVSLLASIVPEASLEPPRAP